MLKTRINELDVYYNEDDNIEELLLVINNNYDLFFKVYADNGLFFSTVPVDDDRCVYADDFNDSFEKLAKKYFYLDSDKEFGRRENLSIFYIDYLLQGSIVQNPFIERDYSITPELLDTIIAKQYYVSQNDFEGFHNYLKNRSQKEKNKILCWLKENCRYETYNYIIEKLSDYLNENGFDYLKTSTSNNIFVDVIRNSISSEEYKLPKISPREIDTLFFEFLNYIKAPDIWRTIYKNLKKNNGIQYNITDDKEKSSMCHIDDIDDDYSIVINYDGTTTGFCTLVHEFTHYITLCFDEYNFALDEFPSIFFEKIAANFLKEKGYSEEVVKETVSRRNANNMDILLSLSTLLTDVNDFIKKGVITREDKINSWLKKMKDICKIREKYNDILLKNGMETQEIPTIPNLEEMKQLVDDDCDYTTEKFIVDSLEIIDGYQYLLGTSLAEALIRKDGNSAIPKMFDVVQDITSYNSQRIVDEFGLSENLDNNRKKEKKMS